MPAQHDLSDAVRRDLGLEGSFVGPGRAVEYARDATGKGLSGGAGILSGIFDSVRGLVDVPSGLAGLGAGVLGRIASNLASQKYREVPAPEVRSIGFRLELAASEPRLVKIVDESGSTLEPRGAGDGFAADRSDPAAGYLLLLDHPVAFIRDDGSGMVLLPGDEGFRVHTVLPEALTVPRLVEIPAPETPWVDEEDDAWLAEAVSARARIGSAWGILVAAGMAVRLYDLRGAKARRSVGELLAGRMDERFARPLRWMAHLTEDQLTTAEDVAGGEVDRIGYEIDELEEELEPSESWWQERLQALCHARDDLEGVLVLLAQVRRGDGLRPILRGIDRRADLLVSSIPRFSFPQDERLRRVRLGAADSWWSRLAPL